MTKAHEDAYKVLSLELSDGLSRKLKEVVTFYPVKRDETTYAEILKKKDSPVKISRYNDTLCLFNVDRAVLSKLSSLMFGLDDGAFSKADTVTLVEGFFAEYLDKHLNDIMHKEGKEQKECYEVDDLSKQHIMYPTDSVELYEFPVQVDGKEIGKVKLCVAEI